MTRRVDYLTAEQVSLALLTRAAFGAKAGAYAAEQMGLAPALAGEVLARAPTKTRIDIAGAAASIDRRRSDRTSNATVSGSGAASLTIREAQQLPRSKPKVMDHRREHARRLLTVPSTVIPLQGGAATNAHLIDLSRHGVGFMSPVQLDPNGRYDLHFQFPGESEMDSVQIEIVYSTLHEASGMFRCGARIYAMGPETVERLVDFVTAPLEEG